MEVKDDLSANTGTVYGDHSICHKIKLLQDTVKDHVI